MTIDRFDQFGDLIRSVARIVVFRFASFTFHHLADEFDGVIPAERVQDDFAMPMIERRGKMFAAGEDNARRWMRAK